MHLYFIALAAPGTALSRVQLWLMGVGGTVSWGPCHSLHSVLYRGLRLSHVPLQEFQSLTVSPSENAGGAAHHARVRRGLADLHLRLLFLQDSRGQGARPRSEAWHAGARGLVLCPVTCSLRWRCCLSFLGHFVFQVVPGLSAPVSVRV